MEYFVEQAASHREAEQKVRAKYGERAKIMHHKTVRLGGFLGLFAREGVEVTGYFSHDPIRPESVRKQLDLEEEKRKILNAARSDKTIDLVLKEIQSIKQRMEEQSAPPAQQPTADHPSIQQIGDLLVQNEFSTRYIAEIISRMRSEFSMEEIEDMDVVSERVVDWIAESIEIHHSQKGTTPRVFILVGPTGVGKTTSIAKLAAMYGIDVKGSTSSSVRILTIDNYRIGAKQQIETYGEIMDIPVSCVESYEDMKKQMALYEDVDYVFVDTIGKSPREFTKLGEMNELLRACGGSAEVHLAMSATTKTSDMHEILRQFEPFGYKSVLVTKLDETSRVGNIISVLHEKQKSVSYITDGQRVPQDISVASIEKLLLNLEGLRINRQRVAERFA